MHGKFTYTVSPNEGLDLDEFETKGGVEQDGRRAGPLDCSPEAVHFETGDDRKAMVSFVLSDPAKFTELSGQGHASHAWTNYYSVVYALIVTLVGIAFPFTEALQGDWMQNSASSIFIGYMYLVACVFLIYLQIDMCLTARAIKKEKETGSEKGSTSHATDSVTRDTANGTELRQRNTPSSAKYDQHGVRTDHHFIRQLDDREVGDKTAMLSHLHDFTSTSVHHEGISAYLRVGFLVFSIGNLVLLIMELIVYTGQREYNCPTQRFLSAKYWQLIFVVIQTLFILFNSKIRVRRRQNLVLFGLMHVLANNLCIWTRTLTEEVWHEYLTLAAKNSYGDKYGDDPYGNSSNYDNYTSSAPHMARKLLAASADDPCSSALLSSVQPYLFPFILEYSLIAVAILATMYQSLTIRVPEAITHSMQRCFAKCTEHDYDPHEKKGCLHLSVWGFCLGLLCAVASAVAISMYFYQSLTLHDDEKASLNVTITSTFLHLFLIAAVIIGLVRLRKFQFTVSRDNSIDDVLLLVSLGGLILMGVFEVIRTTSAFQGREGELTDKQHTLNTFLNTMVILEMVQAVLQTCFVMHGLQRYPANREQQRNKPGRNSITFLVIVNVTLWVFKSMLMKDILLEKTLEMFGAIAGPLIININLPLALYFRFHSSVCLAEMRSCVYEPVFQH